MNIKKLFENIFYELDSDTRTATVVGLSSMPPDNIIIPSSICYKEKTYTVTAIGEDAFHEKWIKSVRIPNSIVTINSGAFRFCNQLSSVVLPSSITEIADSLFEYCNSITALSIPDNVISIGNHAFDCCRSLREIVLPENVTTIGNSAFKLCTSLEAIKIPSSVTCIGDSAFSQCLSLKSINIPNSVTKIGKGVFYLCKNLTSVSLPDNIESLSTVFHYGDKDGFFDGCSSLTTITIQSGVIGKCTFRNCTALTSIILGPGVTGIEWEAFKGCSRLKDIEFKGNKLTSIGYRAFEGCTSLNSISIPQSVTRIDANAFDGTGIYQNDANWINNVLYIDNCLIQSKKEISGTYSINAGTRLIAENAFYDCRQLDNVYIPKTVTNIGQHAFFHTKIYDNDAKWINNVLYIDDCIIDTRGDKVTKAYNIENGTRLIADGAFSSCRYLESISIPESVMYIGSNCFSCWFNLKEIHISSLKKEQLLQNGLKGYQDLIVTEANDENSVITIKNKQYTISELEKLIELAEEFRSSKR